MSDFINTVDLLGDDTVFNSFIDGSITEFKDNVLTTLRKRAFSVHPNLITVDLPNVTVLKESNFYNCANLTTLNLPKVMNIGGYCIRYNKCTIIDLPNVTSIGDWCFYNCAELKTLILRSTTICTLGGSNNFNSTPIASGTGYIYVPRALVDSYKSATNWSTYANQFRALEDYTVDGTTTGELDTTKI